MNISVIVGHPHKKSFNIAIAETVVDQLRKNFHTVSYHDLYEENFDPVLTAEELAAGKPDDDLVKQHCEQIKSADGIIVIHPNWWGQPPAILKGWVDRVLYHGLAFQFAKGDTGGGIPVGLLKAKKAIVFNTSNTGERRENEVFGDPLERLWKNCIFNFCGIHDVTRKMFSIVADSSGEQRKQWLTEVRKCIHEAFPAEESTRTIPSQ
jgi:putative NADPH-quinone reductase